MNYNLYEPKSFEEARNCADSLLAGNGIVLNLHNLDRATAQRLIDFLTGTVYALHGKIQRAGTNVIVCVPNETDITGTIEL
jgi:cell division inhibitor SepF